MYLRERWKTSTSHTVCIHVRVCHQVSLSLYLSRYASYSAILVPFNLVFYFLSGSPLCLPPSIRAEHRSYILGAFVHVAADTARGYRRCTVVIYFTNVGGETTRRRRWTVTCIALRAVFIVTLIAKFNIDYFHASARDRESPWAQLPRGGLSLPPRLPPREPSRVHCGVFVTWHTHTHTRKRVHVRT